MWKGQSWPWLIGAGPGLRIGGKVEDDNDPIITIAALIGKDIAFP